MSPLLPPRFFSPETRNQSVNSYSSPGVLGISDASRGVLNYSERIFGLLKDFQTPRPPTTTTKLFLSKETSESICKCFKGDKVYSQPVMP